jgi:hypothetical protein
MALFAIKYSILAAMDDWLLTLCPEQQQQQSCHKKRFQLRNIFVALKMDLVNNRKCLYCTLYTASFYEGPLYLALFDRSAPLWI